MSADHEGRGGVDVVPSSNCFGQFPLGMSSLLTHTGVMSPLLTHTGVMSPLLTQTVDACLGAFSLKGGANRARLEGQHPAEG